MYYNIVWSEWAEIQLDMIWFDQNLSEENKTLSY